MAKAIGADPAVLGLPKGGASVGGLGEDFSPDLYRGTGNLNIPITLPPGVNGVTPELALSYSSGSGNGILGMGFDIGRRSIKRKTRFGVPVYDDEAQEPTDRFMLAGDDDLIPVGDQRYRPATESSIQYITRDDSGWRLVTQDGTDHYFGTSANSKVFDLAHGRELVFEWLLDRIVDSNGIEIVYEYVEDGAQRYMSEVRYSIFKVIFRYAPRGDSIVNRRAGFDVTTRQRLEAIEVTANRGTRTRTLRRYTFNYIEDSVTRTSLLSRVTISAGVGGDYVEMPTLSFAYSGFTLGAAQRRDLSVEGGGSAPPPLNDPNVSLVDLGGNGLPDVIASTPAGPFIWENLGDGAWAAPVRTRSLPGDSGLGDRQLHFADIEGNGTLDLLVGTDRFVGYLPNAGAGDWEQFRSLPGGLPFDPTDSEMRLVDLSGDGLADVIVSRQDAFVIFRNLGASGWSRQPVRIARRRDIEMWPDVYFSDERVFFADMTGDGLNDIVLVERSQISYWPSLGFGRWGARVRFSNSPRLPRGFAWDKVQLTDIDGNGAADVLLIESYSVKIWINRGGGDFSDPVTIDRLPLLDSATVRLVDLLGQGRPGLLVSPNTTRGDRHYTYLDLSPDATAPFLLTGIDNGLGGVTKVRYGPALEPGRDLGSLARHSFMPFPIQVVKSVEVHDSFAGTTAVTSFEYEGGHYDGEDREFRGFASVTERESGDESSPELIRHHAYHVGADLSVSEGIRRKQPAMLKRRLRALRGVPLSETLSFRYLSEPPEAFTTAETREYSWRAELRYESNGSCVLAPQRTSFRSLRFARSGPPQVNVEQIEQWDDLGNPTRIKYINGSGDKEFVEDNSRIEQIKYARRELRPGCFISAICERLVVQDLHEIVELTRMYYDGEPFVGLALGALTKGNLVRVEELAFEEVEPFVHSLSFGDLVSLGFHRASLGAGRQGWFRNSGRFERDSVGATVSTMDPMGNRQRLEYDAAGLHVVKVIDSLGFETTAEVDYAVEATQAVRNPNGHLERQQYDALGRVTSISRTDDSGVEHPFRLIEYRLPDLTVNPPIPASITTLVPTFATTAEGLFEYFETDNHPIDNCFKLVVYFNGTGNELERRATAESADGSRPRVVVSPIQALSPRGLVKRSGETRESQSFDYRDVALSRPGAGEFAFRFDHQGRIVEARDPDGVVRKTEYDPWFSTSTDFGVGLRSTPTPFRTERYDSLGRTIRIEEDDGLTGPAAVTDLTYDAHGRLLGLKTGAPLFEQSVDVIGQPHVSEHADSERIEFIYNAAGKIVESRRASGAIIQNAYDNLNRLSQVVLVRDRDVQVIRRFWYDADPDTGEIANYRGRLAKVTDEAGALRYRYNKLGAVTSVEREFDDGSRLRLTTEYDWNGSISSIVYPNGKSVSYSYTAGGLVKRINEIIDRITYSIEGHPIEVRYANGSVSKLTYDGKKRLRTIQVYDSSGSLHGEITQEFDALGNIARIDENIAGLRRSKEFAYDQIRRLRTQRSEGVTEMEVEYDERGNITRRSDLGPQFNYSRSHLNRLVACPGVNGWDNWSYDSAGRVVSRSGYGRFDYDEFGRIQKIQTPNGSDVEYLFGYGDRIAKKVVSRGGVQSTTLYLADLFEQTDRGDVSRAHVVSNGMLIGTFTFEGGAERFSLHHSDQLGNVRADSDEEGRMGDTQGFDAWGQPERRDNKAYFIGREIDPDLAGLVRLGTRLYDPRVGRFLSPDDLALLRPEGFAHTPQLLNPYSYAANNPIKFRDPSGRFVIMAFVVGAVVGAYIGYQVAKERGSDPWAGALLGALVGGLVGGFGGWGMLGSAAKSAGLSAATQLIMGGSKENFWTSVAVGFAFGAVSSALPMKPVPGKGAWVNAQNISIEVARGAALSGAEGAVLAAVTGQDFWDGFSKGALAGAASTGLKIALFGVRYDAASGPDPQKAGIGEQVKAKFDYDTKYHDNSYLKSDIQQAGMPNLSDIEFRRHGLLPRNWPFSGRSFVFGNNVNMAAGDEYSINIIAHEVRHIAQQQFFTLGFVGFLFEYSSQYFSPAWQHSYKNTNLNTTFETHH